MTAIDVRHRTRHLRAVRWTGANEVEVQALCVNFEALAEEDRGDDPDATAQLLAAPHSTWVPVYTGDWIVERIGGGFERVRPEDFEERYEVVTT